MWLAPTPVFTAQLSNGPDGKAGAIGTIRKMRALVNDAVTDPAILNMACSIIFLEVQHDERAEVEALFNFVRGQIRYTKDIHGIETLSDPRMTLMRRVGDCDDKATLLATLLQAVGYPTRFVMAGYTTPDTFEHVWLQVFLMGQWIDLDATRWAPMGEAAPGALVFWFENI